MLTTAIVLMGILLGGMLYTTGLVAPIIFTVLEEPDSTNFTRTLWPRYFLVNALVAFVAGIVLLYAPVHAYVPLPVILVEILMLANWGFAKRMQTMRDPGTEYEKGTAYDWMHRFTVWTNTLCILLIGGTLVYIGVYL